MTTGLVHAENNQGKKNNRDHALTQTPRMPSSITQPADPRPSPPTLTPPGPVSIKKKKEKTSSHQRGPRGQQLHDLRLHPRHLEFSKFLKAIYFVKNPLSIEVKQQLSSQQARLAQSVARETLNLKVVGSSPTSGFYFALGLAAGRDGGDGGAGVGSWMCK
jgi:hypothetical protein